MTRIQVFKTLFCTKYASTVFSVNSRVPLLRLASSITHRCLVCPRELRTEEMGIRAQGWRGGGSVGVGVRGWVMMSRQHTVAWLSLVSVLLLVFSMLQR